jgi:hypothetical protein
MERYCHSKAADLAHHCLHSHQEGSIDKVLAVQIAGVLVNERQDLRCSTAYSTYYCFENSAEDLG